MNTLSRTLTGGIMVVIGVVLIVVSLFNVLWVLIYGIPILIFGLFILFNKSEDKIEQRKDLNKTK